MPVVGKRHNFHVASYSFDGQTTEEMQGRLAEVEEAVRISYRATHEEKEAWRQEAQAIKEELDARGQSRPMLVHPRDLEELERIARIPARSRSEEENGFVNRRLRGLVEGTRRGNEIYDSMKRAMEETGSRTRGGIGSLEWRLETILRRQQVEPGRMLEAKTEPAPGEPVLIEHD
jgi:restriction endonuclease Mrr